MVIDSSRLLHFVTIDLLSLTISRKGPSFWCSISRECLKSHDKVEHLEEPNVAELVQPDIVLEHFHREVGIGNGCVSSDHNIYNAIASPGPYKTGNHVVDLQMKRNVGYMPIMELVYITVK